MSTISKETIETANSSDSTTPRVASNQPALAQLHSDAVSLEVPLKVHGSKVTEMVRGVTPHTEPFEEQTSSMIVFPHGGVLRMSTAVNVGQMLVMTNLKSRQDAICRVVKVRTYSNAASYVEVEFTHRQPGYWGVYFESEAAEPSPHSAAPLSASLDAAKEPKAASSTSPSTAAKPSGGNSSFVPFGAKEDIQPSAASMSAPPLPSSKPRAATGSPDSPKPLEGPAAKTLQSQASSSLGAALTAPPTILSAASRPNPSNQTPVLEEDAEADAAAVAESPRARVPGRELAEAPPLGSRFGSAAGSEPSSGSRNWPLIAACVAGLFLVASGGLLFVHRKGSEPPAARIQPATGAANEVPTPPAATSSSPLLPTPSESRSNPPSTAAVRETSVAAAAKPAKETALVREAPVVRESPAEAAPVQPEAAAPSSEEAASKTNVPSVFGTLNAHPVAPTRNVSASAPNLEGAIASSAAENTVLGIPATSSGSILPPPIFNANLPVPVGGRVREPQLVTRTLPQYPQLARQSHTQGDVLLEIVVDKAGNVADAKVVSGPAVLRQAAVDAVRHWKYEPTTLDGQAISVELHVTIRFEL